MGKKNRKQTHKTKNDSKLPQLEERFKAAETRPQFRSVKKKDTKVVLDDRFSSVLTDQRFQLNEKDKYGRRTKKEKQKRHGGGGNKEELSAFYTVEEIDERKKQTHREKLRDKNGNATHTDTDSESENGNGNGSDSNNEGNDYIDAENNNKQKNESDDEENGNEDPASRIAYLTAFSRGEIEVSSSSEDDSSSESSDDDDNDNDEGEDPVYGTAGVLDPSTKEEEIEISYDPSPYLVVTDMDWDHIRAVDLFVILSSFTPPGAVKRVQVFQSDFGMERMAKDRLFGPSDIWKTNSKRKKIVESNKNDETYFENDGDNDDEDDNSTSSKDYSQDKEETKLKIDDMEGIGDTDFDPEKLRAYEASKLKYFFAIVEFSDPDHADIAYREIDGHEFEHSSAAIDLRTLLPEDLESIVKDRPMRDQATSIPGGYEPPEFVVSALQQTNVQCTWDQGDTERERKLTKYGSGAWQSLAESDDLKAYLASDGSSDDESEDEMAEKGKNVRKLLGLDDDDEKDQAGSESDGSSEDEEDDLEADGGNKCMEIKVIPGKNKLEEKIRSKLESKDEQNELTPWEKYKEKRKQKRKERRQAARGKNNDDLRVTTKRKNENATVEPISDSDGDEDDAFFVNDGKEGNSKSNTNNNDKSEKKSQQEIELLLAGEDDEERQRDFDIRGIQRMEKNKGKKLRGSRKRKEEKIAADVSGAEFKVDVHDSRFAAVLEGTDGRFGIDKTDPNFKDTSGMREILAAQTNRRKKRRRQSLPDTVVPDVSAEHSERSLGSSALSSLVQRLKSNVAKKSASD